MNKPRKSWTSLWRLGVCLVLLVWIFHAIFMEESHLSCQRQGIDFHSLSRMTQWKIAWTSGPMELWRALRSLTAGSLVASLAFVGATVFIGAWRWHLVLVAQGLKLPLKRTVEISMVGQFFNAFLLGSTGGDLLKAYYAARETHHLKTEAVTTVFVDRLVGIFSMLIFASVLIIPNQQLLFSSPRLITLTLFILLMTACFAVLFVLIFWGGLSRRFPGARKWMKLIPKGENLERSVDSCRVFGRRPMFLIEIMVVSMILNVFCILQFQALSVGLGIKITWLALSVIVPMIICISALPIAVGGLGIRENLYVIMLAAPSIHVEPTKALSLSLLAYGGFLFWSLIGGMVYLRIKESQHLDLASLNANDSSSTS